MTHPYDPDKLLEDINFFRKRRNPRLKLWNGEWFNTYYRQGDYEYPDSSENSPVKVPFSGWPTPKQPQAPEQLSDAERDFINKTIHDITANDAEKAYWKGTKFLGSGGNGRVGLWEYTGPNDIAPEIKQIVVKEVISDDPIHNFEDEGEIIQRLQTGSQSLHIIGLVDKPRGADAQAEDLDPGWQG
jgi:hypothetical protein